MMMIITKKKKRKKNDVSLESAEDFAGQWQSRRRETTHDTFLHVDSQQFGTNG